MDSSIPDDGTMAAALYGTAHIETLLARESGEKVLECLRAHEARLTASLDVELAETILTAVSELVYSDGEPDGELPRDILDTVLTLRELCRIERAERLVTQWMESADRRGRLIGLGEHSARVSATGSVDGAWKMAQARGSL